MNQSLNGFLSSLLLSAWEMWLLHSQDRFLFADPIYPALTMLSLGEKWAFKHPRPTHFPTFHTPPTMMQRFWFPSCAHNSPNQPGSWLFGQQVFLTDLSKRNP